MLHRDLSPIPLHRSTLDSNHNGYPKTSFYPNCGLGNQGRRPRKRRTSSILQEREDIHRFQRKLLLDQLICTWSPHCTCPSPRPRFWNTDLSSGMASAVLLFRLPGARKDPFSAAQMAIMVLATTDSSPLLMGLRFGTCIMRPATPMVPVMEIATHRQRRWRGIRMALQTLEAQRSLVRL